MFSEKKYVGVALESDAFKIAQVEVTKVGLRLVKVDRFSLVDDQFAKKEEVFHESTPFPSNKDTKDEEIFGFNEMEASEKQEKTEIDFAELEAQANDTDIFALGSMDEEDKPKTNIILLYNILNSISRKQIKIATNIPAGNTIFQILDNDDYHNVKEKELTERIEDKLQAIYGEQKSADKYAYEIRGDGSLFLASIDESPKMLHIIDEVKDFYRGKLNIQEIYSDEIALAGLFLTNYHPEDDEITALLQFGEKKCRIVFLKGEEILRVTSPINTGTESRDFLNVVFSKILFQLDSREIPELNQIIIANNSLGEKAVSFFQNNFSEIKVEEFQYKESFLDKGKFEDSIVSPFTTAVALAAAAAEKDDQFPRLSLLPDYVRERQKIFKLQWHGMVLLFFIFLTLPITNYFYQHNSRQIQSLSTDLQRTNSQIKQIQPIVNSTNEVSQNLTLLTSKFGVLDSLSEGSKAWSAKLDILNKEMYNIPNSWFTSMSKTQDGTFLEGYTAYRNRIPAIVDIFAEATLLNVNTEEVRKKELYKFSMIVQQFSADSSIYSPEKPKKIQQILNN